MLKWMRLNRNVLPRLRYVHARCDSAIEEKQGRSDFLGAPVSFFIAFISIISIWLSPSNPNKQSLNYANLPPKWPGIDLPGLNGYMNGQNKYAGMGKPSTLLLGTDYLGRDLLSRIMVGTRVSLFIGIVATFFDLTIGVFLRHHLPAGAGALPIR